MLQFAIIRSAYKFIYRYGYINLNKTYIIKIFVKKTSVNILRHVYLTSKFGDEIERSKKMNDVAEDMGTSSAQVIGTYIKKD